LGYGQSLASSLAGRLGGKEHLKNPIQDRSWDADAAISYRQFNLIIDTSCGNLDLPRAAVGLSNSLYGINQQIGNVPVDVEIGGQALLTLSL
jgi:hypothetical protein